MLADRLSDLVPAVARHTVDRDMEGEDWEKAVAINGLHATGDSEFVEAAEALVDRCVATQTSAGQFSYGSLDYKPWLQQSHLDSFKGITDPVALGHGVLDVYQRTGDESYLDAARRQYEFLDTVERTEDGGITHRRDEIELWVDSVYMLCPFLARYGVAAADADAALDEAAFQAKTIMKHVKDPHADLCRHMWRETPNMFPQGAFWARGNGWGLAGILDTLERLPDDHNDREYLETTFREIAAAVADLQDASGFWHHILDDPESPLETSGTLMFAYAFMKGREMGLLDDERYADAARDGIEVTLDLVNDDGGVERVARPPGGPDMPLGVTSFGQGWFLMAAQYFLE